jgi:hypothetical protein
MRAAKFGSRIDKVFFDRRRFSGGSARRAHCHDPVGEGI